MNSFRFQDLTTEEQDWLDDYLDGAISPEAFESLQNRLVENAALRSVMRRYLAIDDSLRDVGENGAEAATEPWLRVVEPEKKVIRFPGFIPIAAAAALAFFLGTAVMQWSSTDDEMGPEPSAQGFAVIERLFDASWAQSEPVRREGDLLGGEVFRLASGTAEIQFFSGASMTIEGPAEIALKSAWEAVCSEGNVRMQVPPAARGFKLQAPGTEIIDLGTEFGLSVRDGKGHVEVIDGEISVRPKGGEEQLLTKGAAVKLSKDGPLTPAETGQIEFPDTDRFGSRSLDSQIADFEKWKSHRDALARDERLIAYYAFDRESPEMPIPDLTIPRNPELDGSVILAEPVDGRWPGLKSALEFRRPGARVRVNVPGEFSAFTFATWVRIDSLDRVYNALFMGDSYETGEPHWQIRDDGAMMLSVMVDDSKPNPKAPNDAGLHRVYYSPPMWEMSMSGEWMHLASVFDPEGRAVSHFVNGEQVSTQEIEDKFLIKKLRIGNAEIGNWGLPFREDPWFAIRNLNGRMDEIALFDAALGAEEIAGLFERSRAGRR